MSTIDCVLLISSLTIAAAFICCLPWLCQRLLRSLHHSLRNSSGGAAYNPLQEMIQPQVRHVIEVQTQRHQEAPHDAASGRRGKTPVTEQQPAQV